MHRINFGALKKSVAGAVSTAAHGARDFASDAKEAVERALVAKCLRPYLVKNQIATSGPNGLWKIYTAELRNAVRHYPSVSVWILEKKLLQDSSKGKGRVWEPFLDQQRAGAASLLRLKHPGILKIIEPLEETRTQFVMVTEPIFCSLSDWIGYFGSVPDISESVREVSFTELEIKHGLLQLSSAIGFLHSEVNRAHCSLSPESVLVCADGHWVVSNLGLSTEVDFTGSKTVSSYDFSNHHPALEEIVSKPRLNYIAPELATSHGEDTSVSITPAVDVFSFGLLMYACLTRVDLLAGVEQDIGKYKTRMASILQIDLTALPATLQSFERMLLSASPASRPPIGAVAGCAYFQEDLLLRALQFLEGMVGKDPMQKASFLKDLDQFWMKFDIRILRHKVLPPLLQELQNPNLQSLVIPFIFKAAGHQEKEEFEAHTLPQLRVVLKAIKGDALLTVLNHCDPLTKVMSRSMVAEVLLPVFLQAFDVNVPKIQEEALRKAHSVFECMDYQQLKSTVLPRIHSMSMKTVSAKVRINSLVLMGHLIPRLDKDEAKKMIQTCCHITKVDKSPGTLMCVLGVGDTISKYWGEEMTAEVVLPFLTPLLIGKTLSHNQFGTFLTVIRDMMTRIEEKVGKQIKESEPVKLENAQTKTQTESNWDTTKPKVKRPFRCPGEQLSVQEMLGDVVDDMASWKDLTSAEPSLMTQTPQFAPPAATNASTFDMTPLNSTGFAWPSNTENFFDMGRTDGAMQGSSFGGSTNPTSPHAPAPAVLDPMAFGMGLQPTENGHSSAAPLDFFSGLSISNSSTPNPPTTTPMAPDPFMTLAAPASNSKPNDPFADLLG